MQLDPVRKNPLHVDFFAPNLKKETTASIPLVLINIPEGPGIFNPQLSELMVSGLPSEIPARIEVDCAVLVSGRRPNPGLRHSARQRDHHSDRRR